MENEKREKLIEAYLAAYNSKDVKGMIEHLDERVVFKNFSSGALTHFFEGKNAFKKQAEEALDYFSERKQTVEFITHREGESEVRISYWAIAAVDFPNGINKGQEIELKGKSIFKFTDSKISEIEDFS
ncbi:nuclear transport factor 2 family protein [Algoriphagus boritolerans]|nr:nuclear transport factor 2 family protein [Algoriphagus boritolerans]